MTDQQINEAVAEACGWQYFREEEFPHRWFWRQGEEGETPFDEPPNYVNDLNAMHEAEKTLTSEAWDDYASLLCSRWLKDTPNTTGSYYCHATARQRAIAFLLTLNKWSEL